MSDTTNTTNTTKTTNTTPVAAVNDAQSCLNGLARLAGMAEAATIAAYEAATTHGRPVTAAGVLFRGMGALRSAASALATKAGPAARITL